MLKLILLPGMHGTAGLFHPLINELNTSVEIEAIQYSRDQCLSYPELERLVQAAIPTTAPFVLLAESYSSPLAVTVAAHASSNLRGLAICAGFITSPARGWRRFLSSHLAPIVLTRSPPDIVIRSFLAGSNAPPALLTAVRSALSSTEPKVLIHRLQTILTCDARTDLAKVHVPILYLQATHDRLVATSCLEEIQRIKPKITVEQIAGPHLLLQREPEQSAIAIRAWLRKITQC